MSPEKDFNEIRLNIKDTYNKLGIPSSFLEENEATGAGTLSEILKSIEGKVKDMNCRVMPTSFNADDTNIQAFPYTLLPSWSSCEYALKHFKSNGVMSRLPLFWQIEANLHNACQSIRAYLFLNETENMPLGRSAIQQAGVDTIVTDIEDAHAFSANLLKNNVNYTGNWVVVHPLDKNIKPISEILLSVGNFIAQEVHLFPGVPILDQCEFLWVKNSERGELKPKFHVNDSYLINEVDENTVITTVADYPLPLFQYKVPFLLEKYGECECGKDLMSIK